MCYQTENMFANASAATEAYRDVLYRHGPEDQAARVKGIEVVNTTTALLALEVFSAVPVNEDIQMQYSRQEAKRAVEAALSL